jgi:hypothetical protein
VIAPIELSSLAFGGREELSLYSKTGISLIQTSQVLELSRSYPFQEHIASAFGSGCLGRLLQNKCFAIDDSGCEDVHTATHALLSFNVLKGSRTIMYLIA